MLTDALARAPAAGGRCRPRARALGSRRAATDSKTACYPPPPPAATWAPTRGRLRAGAVTCRGAGVVQPRNPNQLMQELHVHSWSTGVDGDYLVAIMIGPDHTLSEQQDITESIRID